MLLLIDCISPEIEPTPEDAGQIGVAVSAAEPLPSPVQKQAVKKTKIKESANGERRKSIIHEEKVITKEREASGVRKDDVLRGLREKEKQKNSETETELSKPEDEERDKGKIKLQEKEFDKAKEKDSKEAVRDHRTEEGNTQQASTGNEPTRKRIPYSTHNPWNYSKPSILKYLII
jgi:hypothetical protein